MEVEARTNGQNSELNEVLTLLTLPTLMTVASDSDRSLPSNTRRRSFTQRVRPQWPIESLRQSRLPSEKPAATAQTQVGEAFPSSTRAPTIGRDPAPIDLATVG